MQAVVMDPKTGKKRLSTYAKPPKFNYGFLPRTLTNTRHTEAIDLVDLSQKQLKPVLAVSDYLVLGLVGLVDEDSMQAKVLAIEVNEAH
jgi:inorganic pyrophosphatase